MICFQISIFAESYTPEGTTEDTTIMLWFAFKLVSLQSHIHPWTSLVSPSIVVICFQISIFAESYTPQDNASKQDALLWFAFKLVSLQSHIHPSGHCSAKVNVVICFQISIFAESYTPVAPLVSVPLQLWFAFKLVSLQSHIHRHLVTYLSVTCCDLLSN